VLDQNKSATNKSVRLNQNYVISAWSNGCTPLERWWMLQNVVMFHRKPHYFDIKHTFICAHAPMFRLFTVIMVIIRHCIYLSIRTFYHNWHFCKKKFPTFFSLFTSYVHSPQLQLSRSSTIFFPSLMSSHRCFCRASWQKTLETHSVRTCTHVFLSPENSRFIFVMFLENIVFK
jgi:hypothetical protein